MLRILLTLAALFAISATFAKNVNLYEQPKTDAKVVGVIDPAAGIVPIYTPRQGDWVKVGDPKNGNVGWVKSADLVGSNISTGFSFTQGTTNNGQPVVPLMKFGFPQLTPEQTEALYKQLQAQQELFQRNMQQMMQGMPTMVMPVIVMPPSIPPSTTGTTTQTTPQKK